MGEAWSDWYAKDFLINQFPSDDTAANGDVDMGKSHRSAPHVIRSQALDCPVGAAPAQCPGATLAGPAATPTGLREDQRHRARGACRRRDLGRDAVGHPARVGSAVAEAVITQGMRISPPEPTFLDERDAILTADGSSSPTATTAARCGARSQSAVWDRNAVSPTQDTPSRASSSRRPRR
jgi:hypothetical protein